MDFQLVFNKSFTFSEWRTLGVVAAVNGSVEIVDQTIDFLLQEEDTGYDGKTDTFELKKGDYFPRGKLLRQ